MMLDAASQTVACPAIPRQPGDVQSQQRMKQALLCALSAGSPMSHTSWGAQGSPQCSVSCGHHRGRV